MVDPNGFEINPTRHRAIWICSGASGALQVVNNLINGHVANESSGTLDASGNWWGTADAAAVAALVSGDVDYSPWLAVGTDTDGGALGFKGNFSKLWVGADSPQVGTVGRIQEGVNLVATNGTVHVAAGTYDESFTLDKPLTLNGPAAGDKPLLVGMITGTYTGGSATRIENIDFKVNAGDKNNLRLVGVTNLTVKGCAFNADGRFMGSPNAVAVQLDTQKTCKDITIDGCTFANGYYVAIQGWADNLLVKDCLIDNCKSGVNVQHASGEGVTVTNCEINVVAQGHGQRHLLRTPWQQGGLAQNLNIAGCVFTVDRNGLTPDAAPISMPSLCVRRLRARWPLAVEHPGRVVNLSKRCSRRATGSATRPGRPTPQIRADSAMRSPERSTSARERVTGGHAAGGHRLPANLTPVYYLPTSLAFSSSRAA